jgi:hypothetical protein
MRGGGFFFLIVAVSLAGCGPRSVTLMATVPVKGKVLLADGEPVRAGRVTFVPKDADMGGAEPFGDLQKDGTFVLSTQKQGDGAVPGRYVVYIDPIDYRSASPKKLTANPVPERYRRSATSDLVVEVRAGEDDLTLKLKGQ